MLGNAERDRKIIDLKGKVSLLRGDMPGVTRLCKRLDELEARQTRLARSTATNGEMQRASEILRVLCDHFEIEVVEIETHLEIRPKTKQE